MGAKSDVVGVGTIVAPNAGVYTGPGTNTYVIMVGDETAVIDPGPADSDHLGAVAAAVANPVGILVTHGHGDHVAGASELAARLGVDWYSAAAGKTLRDGDSVPVGGAAIEVMATPGHTADSLTFRLGNLLFVGDLLKGDSTVYIEDLEAYLGSLRRLAAVGAERLYPGHGPAITDPDRTLAAVIEHRLEREGQIVAAIAGGAGTVDDIVAQVYADVDPGLYPLAARSVEAHLRKLADDGSVKHRDGRLVVVE